jgi:hypothetical protein
MVGDSLTGHKASQLKITHEFQPIALSVVLKCLTHPPHFREQGQKQLFLLVVQNWHLFFFVNLCDAILNKVALIESKNYELLENCGYYTSV